MVSINHSLISNKVSFLCKLHICMAPHHCVPSGDCPGLNLVQIICCMYHIGMVCSTLWILICKTRCPLSVNCSLQISHWCYFSPWYIFSSLWILLCLTKFPFTENCLLHISQWCAFSPLCILLYKARLYFCINCLLQISHWYGFFHHRFFGAEQGYLSV